MHNSTNIKPIQIPAIILACFLYACGASQQQTKKEEVVTDPLVTSELTEPEEKLYYNVRALLPDLPDATFLQNWDTGYVEERGFGDGLQVNADSFRDWDWGLDDESIYDDSDPLKFFRKSKVGDDYFSASLPS